MEILAMGKTPLNFLQLPNQKFTSAAHRLVLRMHACECLRALCLVSTV